MHSGVLVSDRLPNRHGVRQGWQGGAKSVPAAAVGLLGGHRRLPLSGPLLGDADRDGRHVLLGHRLPEDASHTVRREQWERRAGVSGWQRRVRRRGGQLRSRAGDGILHLEDAAPRQHLLPVAGGVLLLLGPAVGLYLPFRGDPGARGRRDLAALLPPLPHAEDAARAVRTDARNAGSALARRA
eukprot:scaffold2191_cov254-Pinguiococcus_pyrenoidosus.AAC.25